MKFKMGDVVRLNDKAGCSHKYVAIVSETLSHKMIGLDHLKWDGGDWQVPSAGREYVQWVDKIEGEEADAIFAEYAAWMLTGVSDA